MSGTKRGESLTSVCILKNINDTNIVVHLVCVYTF